MASPEESLHLIRQDITNQAKSISALVDEQHSTNKLLNAMTTELAVRKEQRTNDTDRMDRIEERLDNLYSLLKWFLVVFIGAFITAFTTFIVKGGLLVP